MFTVGLTELRLEQGIKVTLETLNENKEAYAEQFLNILGTDASELGINDNMADKLNKYYRENKENLKKIFYSIYDTLIVQEKINCVSTFIKYQLSKSDYIECNIDFIKEILANPRQHEDKIDEDLCNAINDLNENEKSSVLYVFAKEYGQLSDNELNTSQSSEEIDERETDSNSSSSDNELNAVEGDGEIPFYIQQINEIDPEIFYTVAQTIYFMTTSRRQSLAQISEDLIDHGYPLNPEDSSDSEESIESNSSNLALSGELPSES